MKTFMNATLVIVIILGLLTMIPLVIYVWTSFLLPAATCVSHL